MKNILPLNMLNSMIQKLSHLHFTHRFHLSTNGIADEYENDIPINQIFILDELVFKADELGQSLLRLLVMESICGKLGYCLLPNDNSTMDVEPIRFLKKIARVKHDELPELSQLTKMGTDFPEPAQKFNSFKLVF